MTGYGLKIAVIDTGVNAKHPHIQAQTHSVVFDSADTDDSCEDALGHGTAVTAAIQEKAPQADYYILKLFGNSLRTSTSRLIQAVNWAIDHQMDIVNLSLGSPNFEHRPAFETVVRRAANAGVLLVAARYSTHTPVLPGMLDGLISVDVDWDLPRDRYRVAHISGSPVFYASGFPRPLPGVPISRNLSGISFAVANMSGCVARACDELEDHSIDDVISLLTAETPALVP
jgi:hypothetical protein